MENENEISDRSVSNRVAKKRAYVPPPVFTYHLNKRNHNKSYDEYLTKFIQSNIQNPDLEQNLFPFIEQHISENINNDNDKLVDILILYLHVYEYNLRNKKGSSRSKEMMYDESSLLSLQLLLDDIIDMDVEDMIEEMLEEDSDGEDMLG